MSDDDFDYDGWCDYCDDEDGDHQLPDGDWICNDCLIEQFKVMLAKPAVGPATKQIIDMLGTAAGGRDERLSVTIECGGYEDYLGIDVINAFLAEHGAD